MTRTLTTRELNRAVLARQLLLERSPLSIVDALDQVGGLQTQYAPSGYVGLWTRLAAVGRADLTAALEDRSVVQATLMRTTIHLVSRRSFWHYALAIRDARRAAVLKVRGSGDEETFRAAADRLRRALADGPRTVKELDGLVTGFVGTASLWIDLVRVPPSGTWERRRADRLALAADWIGPPDVDPRAARVRILRSYLRAFGPAAWKDVAAWSGLSITEVKQVGADLELARYLDDGGRELVDLPDGPLPDPETPAPVRFLPHWDAALLVHARRAAILTDEHRSKVFATNKPFSTGTVLVDGRVVAGWSVRDGQVVVEPFEDIPRVVRDEVEAERQALEAFHA